MLVVRTPLAGCSLLIPDSCRYLKCTEFGCLLHSRRGRQEQCPDWAIRGVRPKTASRDSALAVFQDYSGGRVGLALHREFIELGPHEVELPGGVVERSGIVDDVIGVAGFF